MHFHMPESEIFIPDGLPILEGLGRTTHISVAAHQDDIEIMSAAPILECFQRPDRWFTGVVVTDGRGSPRDDLYKEYSDEEMRLVRFKEQRKAAVVGEFAAQVMLDYPSRMIKDSAEVKPVEDLYELFLATRPQYVYTHNLADKHDTHVAVAMRTISALRRLPAETRPLKVLGCEVWRDLDWLVDSDKVALDVSRHESLQAALLGVFDSQIAGGKRYDLASMGRRKANATYFESHSVDAASGISWAMDLTPLVFQPDLDITAFITAAIQRFAQDVAARIRRVG
jgi:LmbE family N-acetylglucosaminyl deacetylase